MIKNKKMFEKIVRKSQAELKTYLASELVRRGYKPVNRDGFLYAEGTIPVLLIAHLDTVHRQPVKTICWDSRMNTVMSPEGIGGDDRCGVYMALAIAQKCRCHLLFCEDEETGGHGAYKFADSDIVPAVNYIVECDRKGSRDAVFYDCDNRDFVDFICSYGFHEEYGSFSDISIVAPALGIAAVNISCGYYDQHTRHESVVTDEMERNIDVLSKMIDEAHGTFYEYVERKYSYSKRNDYYSGYNSMYDYYYGGPVYSSNTNNKVAYTYGKYSYDTNGEPLYDEDGYTLPDGLVERKLMLLPESCSPANLHIDETSPNYLEQCTIDDLENFAIDKHGNLYLLVDEREYGYEAEYIAKTISITDSKGKPIKFDKKSRLTATYLVLD